MEMRATRLHTRTVEGLRQIAKTRGVGISALAAELLQKSMYAGMFERLATVGAEMEFGAKELRIRGVPRETHIQLKMYAVSQGIRVNDVLLWLLTVSVELVLSGKDLSEAQGLPLPKEKSPNAALVDEMRRTTPQSTNRLTGRSL